MNISLAGFSVHGLLAEGKIDIFGYLESCRYRFGLQTADIWNGLLPTIEPEFLKKVRQGMEERELQLVNYHVDGVHLWEDDPAARERNYQGCACSPDGSGILGPEQFASIPAERLRPSPRSSSITSPPATGSTARLARTTASRSGRKTTGACR
jgi:hypothetical protein